MSYRNRTGLCGLLIGCSLAIASACGGLDSVKIVITDDGVSGNPGGGNGASGNHQGGTPGGGDSGEGGAAGVADAAGAAGEAGSGGEGGEIFVVPDPMPGAPTVVSVSPRDGLTDADPIGVVRINFSEPLDPASVTGDSVQIKDESGALLSGLVSYADAVATFRPSGRLNLLGKYSVSVSAAVTDAGKTAMERPFSSSFSVRDGGWSKLEGSLTPSSAFFDRSSALALATDGVGKATAVWSQAGDTTTTLDIYAASFVQGKGWAAPVKVNVNPADCQYPSIAMNASGNLIVGWIENEPNRGWSVQSRRNIGGTWDPGSTRVDIPSMSTYTIYPSDVAVAINAKGHAHVAWDWYYYDSATNVNYYGVYTRHVDAAGTWDTAFTQLTPSQIASGVSRPAFAFDADGNGFVAYQFTTGTPLRSSTVVQRYVASTNKWGVSAVASTPSDGYALPAAVATNPAGEAVLSWVRATADPADAANTKYELMGSHYNKAWEAPAVISSATTALTSAKTLAAATWTGTSFLLAWAQSAGTPNIIYANQYKTSWGSAAIISDGNHSAVLPQLSSDGRGNALAVWFQVSDTAATPTVSPTDVMFARFLGASDKWQDPVAVSRAVAAYRYPQVVTLADGVSVAAWQGTVRNLKIINVTGVLESNFN